MILFKEGQKSRASRKEKMLIEAEEVLYFFSIALYNAICDNSNMDSLKINKDKFKYLQPEAIIRNTLSRYESDFWKWITDGLYDTDTFNNNIKSIIDIIGDTFINKIVCTDIYNGLKLINKNKMVEKSTIVCNSDIEVTLLKKLFHKNNIEIIKKDINELDEYIKNSTLIMFNKAETINNYIEKDKTIFKGKTVTCTLSDYNVVYLEKDRYEIKYSLLNKSILNEFEIGILEIVKLSADSFIYG